LCELILFFFPFDIYIIHLQLYKVKYFFKIFLKNLDLEDKDAKISVLHIVLHFDKKRLNYIKNSFKT